MATRFRQARGAATDPAAGARPVNVMRERRRDRRPWWLAAGCTAVVVAALGGSLFVRANFAQSAAPSSRLAAAQSPSWQSVPATSAAASSGAPVLRAAPVMTTAPARVTPQELPVSPAAIVYRLQQLLPAGRTSGYAGSSRDGVGGQIYLDQGQGPGMLRLSMAKDTSAAPTCASSADMQVTCQHLADGNLAVVMRIPDNCIQSLSVTVDHPNGTEVQLTVATCLAWNGTTNPPTTPALTQDQAVKIADDPSWGMTMSSALVTEAQQRFPSLPAFS